MKTGKIVFTFLIGLISIGAYCPPMDMGQLMEKISYYKEMDKKIERLTKIENIKRTLFVLEGGGNYRAKGKSGEFGVYQFMPSTWKGLSKKYFNEVLEQTPENQELVANAYLNELLDKGYNVKQIASVWNCGKPNSTAEGINKYGVEYSVPKYIAKFVSIYNKVNNTKIA